MNNVKCIQESAAEDVICIPVLAFPKASKIGLAETILHKRVRVRVGFLGGKGLGCHSFNCN